MFEVTNRTWQVVQADDYIKDKNDKVWKIKSIEFAFLDGIAALTIVDAAGLEYEFQPHELPGVGSYVTLLYPTEEEAMSVLARIVGARPYQPKREPDMSKAPVLRRFNPTTRSKRSILEAKMHLFHQHGVAHHGLLTPEQLHEAHDKAHADFDGRVMNPHTHER